jgi:hypothetical protein
LLAGNDADFNERRLEYSRSARNGASLDARNLGQNRIAVAARNVARFTVWLRPQMIDTAKPVTIVVNGRERFHGRVAASLATALESYERRHDWGMVDPIKIPLSIAR